METEKPHGGSMQCTAKSKRSQQQCQKAVTPGRQVCHIHGGKTPAGIASASFKHGRYSKYLPTRMLASYNQALRDQSLTLFGEVALLQARIDDLLPRVDTGESGKRWQELRTLSKALLWARAQHDYS